MLYIITKSEDYYPSAGCEDWKAITPDLRLAVPLAMGMTVDNSATVFIIEIDPATLIYRELSAYRNGKKVH